MKWIAVILVLLNLSAWLLGKKVDPDTMQGVNADQVETINASAMSVIQPSQEMAMREENEASTLEEESLAQLKVDQRGQVLTASSAPKVDNSSPANNTNVEAPKPAEIMALDRSKAETTATPVQKPEKTNEMAVPEPAPEASDQAVLTCYRLGPFNNQNSLASVRRALENGGIQYAVDERGAAKKVKAVRVYLGAYATTAALEAEEKRLKKMKIDHYVITLNGTRLVQLGYFSEPARARVYQKTLKLQGIDAKADTIYQEAKIDSWLNLRRASKGSISDLKLPEGTQVKEQACR